MFKMKKTFNFDYYVGEFDFCNRKERQWLMNSLMAAWAWGLKH